tara:strand:- start:172 stop:1839 length:1668 start_codon:yes stop_codon:yes gene_type:complete
MVFVVKNMKRLIANFTILIITLIILCGLLEWVARLSAPSYKEIDKKWVRRYVNYNSDGFRDREYSSRKSRRVFRILALGDSQTFGHGINKLENTFPKRLESMLNEGLENPSFEVLNFALPNWNADSHLQYFFKKGLRYQPDLVLLTYYHNDVPTPAFFDCASKDWESNLARFPFLARIEDLFFYRFLKFRLNRLIEVMGIKPTYEECRRQIYASRGWDMGEMYLDLIAQTSRMKRIHFMMAVLPVLFKLGDDYPFEFAHDKLAKYCHSRGLECLDLYQEGFKGQKANDLIVSGVDRHLNAAGAELTARLIFERLRPLKKLKHLVQFHQAFDLADLLRRDGVVKLLDKKFDQANLTPVTVSEGERHAMFWSDSGMYYLADSRFDGEGKRRFMASSSLERDGRLVVREEKFYDPVSRKPLWSEKVEISRLKVLWKKMMQDPRGKVLKKRSEFIFAYHSKYIKDVDNFVWELELEKNSRFLDPLTLESALFFPEETKLLRPGVIELEKILSFYLTCPLFSHGSGRAYAMKLAEKILALETFPQAAEVIRNLGLHSRAL